MTTVHDFTVKTIDGATKSLGDYKGRVLLVANVASKCGLTPQYRPLQALHEEFSKRGLSVLGFPANDFGRQEPGTEEEIKAFCTTKYDVSFDMFAKVVVTGEAKAPLYEFLTDPSGSKFGGPLQWNFTKFLVGKNGEVLARFEPGVDPASAEVRDAIERALAS